MACNAPSLDEDKASLAPSIASSSSASSSSSSFSRSSPRAPLPLPPPPAPLPTAYAHPAAAGAGGSSRRRAPLPAPPRSANRFVPLHPPVPPPKGSKGKAREDAGARALPTAAEEKAAVLARERGLDELFDHGRRAEAVEAADTSVERSPTGTELPEYALSPGAAGGAAAGALRRSATAAKRAAGLFTDTDADADADHSKRAQAEAEVRARVNAEARQVVEDDAAVSKAALARRRANEDREAAERGARRHESELEKRLEALRVQQEDDDDDGEPPPPISPEQDGRRMLPLVDSKEPLFDSPTENE
ncbi:hypothetical protein JCM3770_002675 [Rhodotorula araucariae]